MGPIGAKQSQMVPNGAKQGQTGSSVAKCCLTGPNMAKRAKQGQTRPNGMNMADFLHAGIFLWY